MEKEQTSPLWCLVFSPFQNAIECVNTELPPEFNYFAERVVNKLDIGFTTRTGSDEGLI